MMCRVRSSSLSRPRALVLLDHVLLVLVHREARGDARLLVPAHPQAIEVQRRLVLHHQRRVVPQRIEVVARLGVDLGRVRIGAGRQIDLRSRDVQEAQGIAGRELAGLLGADDVVGDRRHGRGVVARRPQCAERSNDGHPAYSMSARGVNERLAGLMLLVARGAATASGFGRARLGRASSSGATAGCRATSVNAASCAAGIGSPGAWRECTATGLTKAPFLFSR